MARNRKIEADDILDAVERVVVRNGTAGLSIDAVAKEAGVSKSRVVYDHKSKSGLLDALIKRHLDAEKERLQVATEANVDSPHPELYARIAIAEPSLSDVDRAVAMAISTAMTSEVDLQNRLRDWSLDDIKAISNTDRPDAAMLSYLALLGFYWNELSGFHISSDAERHKILNGIRTIYTSYPEPEAPSRKPSS